MEESESKTSDEIINELFLSLNIPVNVPEKVPAETPLSPHSSSPEKEDIAPEDTPKSLSKKSKKKHKKEKKAKKDKKKKSKRDTREKSPSSRKSSHSRENLKIELHNSDDISKPKAGHEEKSSSKTDTAKRNGTHSSRRSADSSRDLSKSPVHKRRRSSRGRYRYSTRSRSRSRSRSCQRTKHSHSSREDESLDPLDAWKSAKLASLRRQIKSSEKSVEPPILVNLESEETPTDSKGVSIDSIPLPGDTIASGASATIPVIDLASIPIPNADKKTMEKSSKTNEKAREEGKSKTIIIKDLKTSLVYQQAVQEAQKKTETIKEGGETQKDDEKSPIRGAPDSSNLMEEGEIDGTRSESPKKTSKSKSSDRKSSRPHRSRSPSERSSKRRRRSRSRHRRRRDSSSRSRSRDDNKRRRRSEERHSSSRRRSRKRSRSRSRSSRKRRDSGDADSFRDKSTRKKLLEIARKNAVYLMKNDCLPAGIQKESLKITGKSVNELTDFCKKLVNKEDYSDVELSDPCPDDEEQPFASRHPFIVKDKPILMNIRNAPMLPTKTNAERLADQSKLREQFPVSSGSQHRTKESGWVPVEKDEKKVVKEDKVFPEEKPDPTLDISNVVSNRLKAIRNLVSNPQDNEAINQLNSAQQQMQHWAMSKQVPGQFTGSTGARVMSFQELSAGHQAWARKEQFREANPVSSHFGLKMLQKMGWTPGEGLGKNKEGSLEPLLLDVKMDKKGLHSMEEMPSKKQPIPLAKNLAGKHPVSALVELCSKRRWHPPEFEIVFDCGPDHKKNFLMKAIVNGKEYKPSIATSTKKIAKANAAAACLQALGVIPKDSSQMPLVMSN